MTPADTRLAQLAAARTRRMEPAMRAAWLRSLENLRQEIGAAAVEDLLRSGLIDQILTPEVLDRAFAPMRAQLRSALADGFRFTTADIQGAIVQRAPVIVFDFLSENVRRAALTLDNEILAAAKEEVREVVRLSVANGLERGAPLRAVARETREVIGLAKNQVQYVENLRRALESGDAAKAVSYDIDKRFVKMIEKGGLTQEKIDRIVESYRARRIAQHSLVVTQRATLNSYRAAQQVSFQEAIDSGVVDGDRAQSTWINTGDSRVRPEHRNAPEGVGNTTVPFGTPFANGLVFPQEWGCRCLLRHSQRSV